MKKTAFTVRFQVDQLNKLKNVCSKSIGEKMKVGILFTTIFLYCLLTNVFQYKDKFGM